MMFGKDCLCTRLEELNVENNYQGQIQESTKRGARLLYCLLLVFKEDDFIHHFKCYDNTAVTTEKQEYL